MRAAALCAALSFALETSFALAKDSPGTVTKDEAHVCESTSLACQIVCAGVPPDLKSLRFVVCRSNCLEEGEKCYKDAEKNYQAPVTTKPKVNVKPGAVAPGGSGGGSTPGGSGLSR